jgi:hypothetical protein
MVIRYSFTLPRRFIEILVVKFVWSVSRHTSIVDRGEIRVPSFEIESSGQRCLKSLKLSAQGLS